MSTKNDLVIEQGTTFVTTISLVDDANNPLDLTGFTSSAQMKKHFTSRNSIAFTTAISISNGTITLTLPAATTITTAAGRYVYDVTVADLANTITRVVEGIVVVTPGVTNISTETTANTYNPNTDFSVIPLNSQTI